MSARWIIRTLLLAAVVELASCAVLSRAGIGSSDKPLNVYFIDTEGGASVLMVTPSGESLLVDTGNPGTRDPNRIVAAAHDAGISKIDYLVITHYHSDHFGGLAELAKQIPIGTLYDNADKNASRERPTAAYLAAPVGKRSTLNPGDFLPLKEGDGTKLKVQVLAARTDIIPDEKAPGKKPNPFASEAVDKPRDTSDNASSIVELLSFGDFRFYDGGDVTWNIEKNLVTPINRVGGVDVYQVTHHGLALSNNPVLVKALEPTVAIMNNGPTKGCEPQTFATLKAAPTIKDIWQLHKNLRPDGATNNTSPELIANTDRERDCKGEYIKMTVAADAKSYTVSIPSTHYTQTYRTKSR